MKLEFERNLNTHDAEDQRLDSGGVYILSKTDQSEDWTASEGRQDFQAGGEDYQIDEELGLTEDMSSLESGKYSHSNCKIL